MSLHKAGCSYLLCAALTTSCIGAVIRAAADEPSTADYVRPHQKVEEFICVGDSYTAGTGCNGKSREEMWEPHSQRGRRSYPHHMITASISADDWEFINGDPTIPRLSWPAYTGDTSVELVQHQLKQGPYKEDNSLHDRDQPFGAPQLAVMSIGGNDAYLGEILNNCIYRAWRPGDCQETITKLQGDIDSGRLRDKISVAISNVINAGRMAAGANPTNSFQVFVVPYAQFFNQENTECDSISWHYWSRFSEKAYMTTALRRQLNDLTKKVNAQVKDAVYENGRKGAFLVDGIDDLYPGHRYCEPGHTDNDMKDYETWFWSPHQDAVTTSEGIGDPNVPYPGTQAQDSAQALLDFVFPGQNRLVSQTSEASPPWTWSGAEKYPTFDSLLAAVQSGDDVSANAGIFALTRSFHPKATAYRQHAKLIFGAIADNRDQVASTTPGAGGSSSGTGGPMIALASYTNPIGDPAAWQRLISYDSKKLSILVANVLNGPDYVVEPNWASVIQQAAASGKTVIGYVRTGYLGVSSQKFKTRLGSSNLADWTSQIEQDVDKWYELYGSSIGGIFFDEGWPECGPNNLYSNLYAHINAYTKRKHPGAYTVLNPGSPMAQCFEETMDTLLTFESSYESYVNSYVPNDWTPKDDKKIWHIIYRVPQDKISEIAQLSRSRHAGYVEMTDDDNPNPYDNVPSEAYMQAAMATMPGGTVGVAAAKSLGGSYIAGVPSDTSVIASDYTSVTLSWSPVANALGYAIYQNGQLVLEMPSTLTRAQIGMLKPATSDLSFEVKTVLSGGGGGGASVTVAASTQSLPAGGAITNIKYNKAGSTVTFNADVLVPYAFVRLFIGGPHERIGNSAGWPIIAGTHNASGGNPAYGRYKLVNYLVEGNDFYSAFYKYSGAYVEGGSSNADWTWTPQGTAPQSQSGYTYTWTVPLGGTDALPEDYVIQGQGYAPLENVFGGTLRAVKCLGLPCDEDPHYDCQGQSLCGGPNFLKWCDGAANTMIRSDELTYNTFGDPSKSGHCDGNGIQGCAVFLQGNNCQMSGNDMWHYYNNIRSAGGCSSCGSYRRDDGCYLSIDYTSTCQPARGW